MQRARIFRRQWTCREVPLVGAHGDPSWVLYRRRETWVGANDASIDDSIDDSIDGSIGDSIRDGIDEPIACRDVVRGAAGTGAAGEHLVDHLVDHLVGHHVVLGPNCPPCRRASEPAVAPSPDAGELSPSCSSGRFGMVVGMATAAEYRAAAHTVRRVVDDLPSFLPTIRRLDEGAGIEGGSLRTVLASAVESLLGRTGAAGHSLDAYRAELDRRAAALERWEGDVCRYRIARANWQRAWAAWEQGTGPWPGRAPVQPARPPY